MDPQHRKPSHPPRHPTYHTRERASYARLGACLANSLHGLLASIVALEGDPAAASRAKVPVRAGKAVRCGSGSWKEGLRGVMETTLLHFGEGPLGCVGGDGRCVAEGECGGWLLVTGG